MNDFARSHPSQTTSAAFAINPDTTAAACCFTGCHSEWAWSLAQAMLPVLLVTLNVTTVPDAKVLVHTSPVLVAKPLGSPRGLSYSGCHTPSGLGVVHGAATCRDEGMVG
jgi:hypothetical protein